ncbi:hypothetical protein GF327_08420 [Candidatus Woesearchaeota archaeon]|nr:hypothetical protein [Candidatus Woesearchaeota archaeon]
MGKIVRSDTVTMWLEQDQPVTFGDNTITVVEANETMSACGIQINAEQAWIKEGEAGFVNNQLVKVYDIVYGDNPYYDWDSCLVQFGMSSYLKLPEETGHECTINGQTIYNSGHSDTYCKICVDDICTWIEEDDVENVNDVPIHVIDRKWSIETPTCGSQTSFLDYWCEVVTYYECIIDKTCCKEFGDSCGVRIDGGYYLDEDESLVSKSCVDSGPNMNKYKVVYRDYDCSAEDRCSFTNKTKYVGSCCVSDYDCGDGNECTTDSCINDECMFSYVADDTVCSLGTCQDGVCTTCGNSQCDTGETFDSCPQDCGCQSDVDCPKGYFCNLNETLSVCQSKQLCFKYDEYYCYIGNVYACLNLSGYYEPKIKDICLFNEQCNPNTVNSTHECESSNNSLKMWIDDALPQTLVNKQKGDILKLSIESGKNITLPISYHQEALNTDCLGNYISLIQGNNHCWFTVTENATERTYEIKLGNKSIGISVLENPALLIITDSEKLKQRYPDEKNGVKNILSQAYTNAQDNGVLYDLSLYDLGAENPFTDFNNYDEKQESYSWEDNSYSVSVADFINGRCDGCEDIMIVGDDFVVPHYRREIPEERSKWLFFDKEVSNNIYTDIPYAQKSLLLLSDYSEIFKRHLDDRTYVGKPVLIIYPDNSTTEMFDAINELKNAFNNQGFFPSFSNMSGDKAECYDDSWGSEMQGKSLVIIGDEDTNNAFKCMPFVSGVDHKNTLFMQPNVWDTEEYAFVINTNDPEAVNILSRAIKEKTIENLKSSRAYMLHLGVEKASWISLGVGITALAVPGGQPAGAAFIAAAGLLDGVVDGADALDTCVVNYDGIVSCGFSGFWVIVPLANGRVARKFVKNGIDILENIPNTIKKRWYESFELLTDSGTNKLMAKHLNDFHPEDIDTGLRLLIEENEIMKKIDDWNLYKKFKKGEITQKGFSEAIGSLGNVKNYEKFLQETNPQRRLFTKGYLDDLKIDLNKFAEVKIAAKRIDQNHEVIALGRRYNNREYDLISKIDFDSNKVVVEEIANGKYFPKKFEEDVKKLIKLRQQGYIDDLQQNLYEVSEVKFTMSNEFFRGLSLDDINYLKKNHIKWEIFDKVK